MSSVPPPPLPESSAGSSTNATTVEASTSAAATATAAVTTTTTTTTTTSTPAVVSVSPASTAEAVAAVASAAGEAGGTTGDDTTRASATAVTSGESVSEAAREGTGSSEGAGAGAGAGAGVESSGDSIPAAISTSGKKPIVCLVIGMAGSGKTTLVQRLNAEMHMRSWPGYFMNLDPAVTHLPYEPNIDIRDTVNYKEVMKQFQLGPNGGIITALNLFSTRFDQVLSLLEKRTTECRNVFIDTPGQIEVFTWSASGSLITDSLAASHPTVAVFVIDTPRTKNPTTFMSNMLYACSIMYKTRLPFVLVFNKTDVESHDFAVEWMEDFEAFQAALDEQDAADDSYINSLTRSLSLVLDEFYSCIKTVGVSAYTGAGMDAFFSAVDAAGQEYIDNYLPELEAAAERRKHAETAEREESLKRLAKDIDGTVGTDGTVSSEGVETEVGGAGATAGGV